MTYLQIIIKALTNLGGHAHYSEIYLEFDRIRGSKSTSGIRAGIRGCIEVHSSDSLSFRGKDIFYSVEGIGRGVWGLRPNSYK